MPNIADINLETRDLCDADTTSYVAATLLRRINAAYERVVGWILEADGTWQWDDTNYSDLPIGIQTLIEGQRAYSFNDKFLEIEEVQVKDVNGNFRIIHPIDQKEYSDWQPLEEDFKTDDMPTYYDKVSDDTIKFFAAPTATAVTLINGLKIKFRRTADIFTSAQVTTGIKVPGFISTYHYILSYMAAIPYCMNYKKDRVTRYERIIGDTTPQPTGMKKSIIEAYSRRERDTRKQITMRQRPYK